MKICRKKSRINNHVDDENLESSINDFVFDFDFVHIDFFFNYLQRVFR